MVKLSFLCHDPWYSNQADPFLRSLRFLADHGYQVEVIRAAGHPGRPEPVWPDVSRDREEKRRELLEVATQAAIASRPDMILCHHRSITPTLLRSGLPLAILEHTDAPALEISRYLIHLDGVVGIIKGTVFSDFQHYNGPFCEGMFHGQLINSMNLPCTYPELLLSAEDLSKIELGWSFGAFPCNKRLVDRDIDTKREIPISFVGQTDYPRSRLVTRHRHLAMTKVKSIPGGVGKNGVPVEEFDRILFSSYICLSPLGYGACYRSFEGLYAGCVVVQPDCSYMKSWPNVYVPGRTYFPCDANFDNLEEVVSIVLDNWRYWHEKRMGNKELLTKTYWDQAILGSHIKGILDRCLQRIK